MRGYFIFSYSFFFLIDFFTLDFSLSELPESTVRRLSVPAPLSSIIMIDGPQSWILVWGHVMAAGACLARRTGGRMGSQVAASGLGIFLEHTPPVALQAWLAEHLSAMSRPAGRADSPSSRPAKWTSCTSGRPSGICWLIFQSDSMITSCVFQNGACANMRSFNNHILTSSSLFCRFALLLSFTLIRTGSFGAVTPTCLYAGKEQHGRLLSSQC